MQALFVQAQIRRDIRDQYKSMSLACEGYDIASELSNPLWQGRFAQLKSNLFDETGDYLNSAVFSMNASRAYAHDTGEASKQRSLFSAADASIRYCVLRDYDRSLDILDSLELTLDRNNPSDISVIGYITQCRIPVEIERQHHSEALMLIDSLKRNPYYAPIPTVLCYESYALFENDSIEKARTLLDDALERAVTPNDSIHIYDGLRHYADKTHDLELYASSTDSIFSLQVRIDKDYGFHYASSAMQEYNILKSESEKEAAHRRIMLFLFLFVACAVIIGAVLIFMRRKANLSEKRLIDQATQINKLTSLLLSAENTQLTIYREKWRSLNNMLRNYYELNETDKFKSMLLDNLKEEISNMCSESSLDEIERSINQLMDNVVVKIREQCTHLSETEIRVLIYTLAGWSPVAIGLAIDKTKGACGTLKNRILNSIEESDAPDREWILSKFERRKRKRPDNKK